MKTLALILSIILANSAAQADQLAYDYSFPQEFTSQPQQRRSGIVYKLPVAKTDKIKRVEVSAEIFHDGWNSFQYRDTYKHLHGLFWITRGKKWKGNVLAWAALKEKNRRLKLGSNIGMNSPLTPGTEKRFRTVPTPRQWHNVNFVYDAPARKLSLITRNQQGQSIAVTSSAVSSSPTITNSFGYYLFHFGHNFAEHGPETSTDGWKIRNLRIKFYK